MRSDRDEPQDEVAGAERSWAERLRDELVAAAARLGDTPAPACERTPRPRARRG